GLREIRPDFDEAQCLNALPGRRNGPRAVLPRGAPRAWPPGVSRPSATARYSQGGRRRPAPRALPTRSADARARNTSPARSRSPCSRSRSPGQPAAPDGVHGVGDRLLEIVVALVVFVLAIGNDARRRRDRQKRLHHIDAAQGSFEIVDVLLQLGLPGI